MRLRISVLFSGVMLLSSILAFDAPAQEVRRLGVNTTLPTYEEDIKYLKDLGVGAIRVPLQWQFIKIRPGEYDWSDVDRLLKAAQTKQINVLFTIRTTFAVGPQKHRPRKGAIQINPPSMDMKEWVHFVEILANRYQGQGVNYEIENEVNEAAFWKGTLEEYLELLKAGYDAVKKADPKAKVLPSAMGCGIIRNLQLGSGGQKAWKWHDSWLEPVLSTKKFDAVSVHDYYFPSEIVANGLTFRSYLEHIRDIMKKSGSGNLPIWITETGFVSLPADVGGRTDKGSYERQAQWLTEAYQQAFEFGVERIYWLLLRDRKEPYFGSMGLADAKGDRRPAWNVLHQFGTGKEQK
ncbi:MAG: cellulase family glycosylhydrolase [Thermodesulfobacteriota bacterium]